MHPSTRHPGMGTSTPHGVPTMLAQGGDQLPVMGHRDTLAARSAPLPLWQVLRLHRFLMKNKAYVPLATTRRTASVAPSERKKR